MSYKSDKLISDATATLTVRIFNAILAAVLGIITARLLGPADRGVFLVPAVLASFMVAMCSGLTGATTFFLIRHKLNYVPRVVWLTGGLVGALGASLTAILALLSHNLWALFPATIAVFSAAGSSIASGYFYAINRIGLVNVLAAAGNVTSLLLIGGSLILIKRDPHTGIIAWALSLAMVAVGANGFIGLSGKGKERNGFSLADFLAFSLKMGAGSLVSLLNYRIDVYLVALMTSSAGLGLYTVAVAGAESILTVTQVAASVTLPHIGAMDRTASINLTARTCRNNLALAIALCSLIFLFAPFLVKVLYGFPFLAAVPSLRILLVGVLCLSTGSVISSYFTVHLGKPYVPLTVAATSAVICLVVSIFLIPRMGIVGGAIATAVSYLLTHIVVMLYFSGLTKVPLSQLYFLQRNDVRAYLSWAAVARTKFFSSRRS